MEPDAVLSLFDSFWFHLQILNHQPEASSPPSPNPHDSSILKVSRQLSRSKSEDLRYAVPDFHSGDVSDPGSELLIPHLQTILSQKEFSSEIPKSRKEPSKGSKLSKGKRKAGSRSLSELEFEELKGFMDLGFVFSEEDRDSSLVEIIPGLQRLGKAVDSDECHQQDHMSGEELPFRRPYLSEAWEFSDRQEEEESAGPLLHWKVPAVGNEIDMKDSLKWWAHTVASAVR